jgi:hypothetical protein
VLYMLRINVISSFSTLSGVCEVSSFQTGQRSLIAAACSRRTTPSPSHSHDQLRSMTPMTQNMPLIDSLNGRSDSKNRTAGRAESASLMIASSDSGDVILQKKGKADLNSTTTSESVEVESKSDLKQKQRRTDSATARGRSDPSATLKSTDSKRKSLEPPHAQAHTAGDAAPSSASVPVPVPVSVSRTVLTGDSTVEWFSRILDPDGESEGDIVGMGKIAFASRNSDVRDFHLFCSYHHC